MARLLELASRSVADARGRNQEALLAVGQMTTLGLLASVLAMTAVLWSVSSATLLIVWSQVGLLVGGACWLALRTLDGSSLERAQDLRKPTLALGLVIGCFWGVSAWVVFPESSPVGQALFAFVLLIMMASWLPVLTLELAMLLTMAVPASVPAALRLMTSSDGLAVSAGFILLAFLAVIALVAHASRGLYFAELASRRDLHHRATHDSLVDLLNHAEFHRRLQGLASKAHDYAILFVDLDRFKAVNDAGGHAVGDALLRDVGGILRAAARGTDPIGRLGGDEFAIVMHNCSAGDAARVATLVHDQMKRLPPTAAGLTTASIGIACSGDPAVAPAQVLAAADRACYEAKRRGRAGTTLAVVRRRAG